MEVDITGRRVIVEDSKEGREEDRLLGVKGRSGGLGTLSVPKGEYWLAETRNETEMFLLSSDGADRIYRVNTHALLSLLFSGRTVRISETPNN